MKKKIITSLTFVILAAGILLIVFLPGNKKQQNMTEQPLRLMIIRNLFFLP